jgi:hypothetical protein
VPTPATASLAYEDLRVEARFGTSFDLVPMVWPEAQARWLLDQGCWSDTDGVFWWPRAGLSETMPAPKIPTSVAFIAADGSILIMVDVAAGVRLGDALPMGTTYALQVRQGLLTSHAVKDGDIIYAYDSYGGVHLVPLKKMPTGG